MEIQERSMATCPLCRQQQWLWGGRFREHTTGVTAGDHAYPVGCMAGGLSLTEARVLVDRMAKAAHP